jgi:predicted ATPase
MGIETTVNFDNVVLVGREHEISCLQEAFQRVKEGNGQESIFLRGESGSGKTSVLNELQESCATPVVR